MAAFSHQYCPFLLDSVFLPNTPQTLIHDQSINYIPQIHDSTTTNNNNSFDTSVHASVVNHETSNSHLPQKQTTDQSSVVVDSNLDTSNDQVSQRVNNMVNPSKNFKRKINNSTASSLISSDHSMVDGGKGKGKKQKKCITEAEDKKSDNKKKKVNESEPPTGYIHVRARRGQATDSHSLAERVRREKISERMKTLQRLVPGCDKVTGKALMLDEIINYVQSLQNQVEFLSMKLASVSPFFYDFGMGFDALMMVRPTETTAFGGDDHHTITNPTITSNSITTNTNTNTNIFPTPNSCQVLDSSSSLLFHGHRPTTDLMEGRNSALWEVEEPRQRFLSPSGFGTHLCSFQ